jgi:hypothetical protein
MNERLLSDQKKIEATNELLLADQKKIQASNQQLLADQKKVRQSNERLLADQEKNRAINEWLIADQQKIRAINERLLADQEKIRAANERLTADQEKIGALNKQLLADQEKNSAANGRLIADQQKIRALNEQLLAARREQTLADQSQIRAATEQRAEPRASKQRLVRANRSPRCFVGFFGLNRSLRWTSESIRLNVLGPLADFGCDVVSAVHLNCPDIIINPRSGEIGVPVDDAGIEQLEPALRWLESQCDDSIAAFLPLVMRTPLKFEDDSTGQTRKNILHQLHSLRQLARLLDVLDAQSFDIFVFLRTDLLYIDPIPVPNIVDSICYKSVDLITARWHQCSGLNDRFAFCSARGAHAYLQRIKWVPQFCNMTGSIHSESLLGFVADRMNLKCDFTDIVVAAGHDQVHSDRAADLDAVAGGIGPQPVNHVARTPSCTDCPAASGRHISSATGRGAAAPEPLARRTRGYCPWPNSRGRG